MKTHGRSNLISGILAGVVIAVGFCVIVLLNRNLETRHGALPKVNDRDQLVLQGSRLKGFVFGAEGLVADWYWMTALQYIGDKLYDSKSEAINIDNLRPLNPRLLYPYLDIATDLDPAFMTAYSYGAVVLPAIDAEKAIALTKKGIERNPQEWKLYQYLGYIYWRLGRYQEAGEVYEKGSLIPNSPNFLRMMAVSMKTEGSGTDSARTIYTQMYNESDDEQTKLFASRKLLHLDSLEERKILNDALVEFRDRAGKCASDWTEIIPWLRKGKLPNGRAFRLDAANNVVDPSDAPYLIDQQNCQAVLDRKTTKIQLQ